MSATVTVEPLGIICIRCGAGIGEPCRSVLMKVRRGQSRPVLAEPHRDRFALARVLRIIEDGAAQCDRDAAEYAEKPALTSLVQLTKGQASGMRTAAQTVRSMLGGPS